MIRKVCICLLLNILLFQEVWSQDQVINTEAPISNSFNKEEISGGLTSQIFSLEEAPYIGGIIQNKKFKNNFLRMVCMEIKVGQCVSIAFVSVIAEKRTQLSSHLFPIEQLILAKNTKIKNDILDWLPFTTAAAIISAVFGGIGGFLLLPIDLVALPVRAPILIVKKLKMKKSLRVLTNLKETKKIALRDIPFDEILHILKALKPKSNL